MRKGRWSGTCGCRSTWGDAFFPFSQLVWPQHRLPRPHSEQQRNGSHHTHAGLIQPPGPDTRLHGVCHEPPSSVLHIQFQRKMLWSSSDPARGMAGSRKDALRPGCSPKAANGFSHNLICKNKKKARDRGTNAGQPRRTPTRNRVQPNKQPKCLSLQPLPGQRRVRTRAARSGCEIRYFWDG